MRRYSKKFLINLCLSVGITSLTIGLPIAITANADKIKDMIHPVDNTTYLKYEDDFLKSDRGDILRLPIDKNPIPVVLGEMDEQTKEYIVDGINALDEISENINYTIYDYNDFDKPSDLKYISFNMIDEIYSENSDPAGRTYIRWNENTAEIQYPIRIELENYYADGYWDKEYTQSVLTTIVKHELMHTLGFRDLYKDEDISRSIMFYQIGPLTQRTFTEEDIEKIQYCYDGKEIAVSEHPNTLEVLNYTNLLDKNKKTTPKHDDEYSL